MTSMLLLGLALAGCASGPNTPSPELLQRIEVARTRGDHEALVTYYDREAIAARANATGHRTMAKSYRGTASNGRGATNTSAHCNSIASLYQSIAAEYDGLAGDHRQMATSAPL